MRARPVWKWTLLLGLACHLSGCSSFNREWRAASKSLNTPDDIVGRWEGTWTSTSTGHQERLRCLITKQNERGYTARFHAKYRHVLSFGYTVPLKVRKVEREFQFEGEADLGKLAGGVYAYKGAATPTNYFSTYDSKYDHGTFRMTPPR